MVLPRHDAVEDQPAQALRVPDGGREGDPAAAEGADQDRVGDAEGVAEVDDVVGPALPGPLPGIAAVRATAPPLVQVDDLGELGHGAEHGLEQGVVRPGPPCRAMIVGRSAMDGPSGTRWAPSTSK